MKIAIAQTRPIKGDIEQNIKNHLKIIQLATKNAADLIIFPELSITGYEPSLAKALTTTINDSRFDKFQAKSDLNNIIICAGFPEKSLDGILISLAIFQPNSPRQTYAKQHLHADEIAYFINGTNQVYINFENHKIAPAICYESLLAEHSEIAAENGANIYLASVAKSINGIEKAFNHYPMIAKKHQMVVLMANCIGENDDFIASGNSGVWNRNGDLLEKLGNNEEGLLIFDTNRNVISNKIML